MKTIVFRVEDRDGLGFYQRLTGESFLAFCDTDAHPAPRHDKGALGNWYNDRNLSWDDNASMFYGFQDENQMIGWMVRSVRPDIFDEMVDKGVYFIKRYQIDEHHVIYGERQLVFKKSEAICVETLPYAHMRELIKRF